MTPEASVKKKVKEQLDALGAWYFMPAMGSFGRAGIPDIVGCFKGRCFGIEAKAGRNQATALQLREMDKIKQAGGIALLINEDNIDEVTRCLSRF